MIMIMIIIMYIYIYIHIHIYIYIYIHTRVHIDLAVDVELRRYVAQVRDRELRPQVHAGRAAYAIVYCNTITYYTVLWYNKIHYTALHYTTIPYTQLYYTILAGGLGRQGQRGAEVPLDGVVEGDADLSLFRCYQCSCA